MSRRHPERPAIRWATPSDERTERMAKAIRARMDRWDARLARAADFPSTKPTRRDEAEHEAWLQGAVAMLSFALFGSDGYAPKVWQYLLQAPWRNESGQ